MEQKRVKGNHTWRFFRAGGFDQVRLDSGDDLLALEHLDQKLWVALACPVDNVFFDIRTLSLIDSDGDRRVRAPELLSAIKWTASLLKNPNSLAGASRPFYLDSIADTTDEGKALILAMRNALSAVGKSEADPVSVADICSLEQALKQKPFNGDGVITVEAATDERLRDLIQEIIAALGSVPDRSGEPGIDSEKIESYFGLAQAYIAWTAEFDAAALRFLGDGQRHDEAFDLIARVEKKIDDFFTRCAIASYDERSLLFMNGGEKAYEAIGSGPLSREGTELVDLPLARVEAGGRLPLTGQINPAWADAMNAFEGTVIRPLLGNREVLSESEWRTIQTSLYPWLSWQKRKPTRIFDGAATSRVQELLAGDSKQVLLDLVSRDAAQSATFESLGNLEKLVRFHRDLHSLCTNFVNFKDFYSREGSAIFIAGTLYLDQRSCGLCIKVDEPNRHCLMAAMAGAYLAYCACSRRGSAEKMNIVAAFTNGDSDNLLVGRNGVFYDRQGNDWDACITKIIDNPISLRQAFWQPYKGLVRMIETQVARRATSAEARSASKLEQSAVSIAQADKAQPEPPPKKLDIGIVAALGVAAGALGTFIATLLGYASGIIQMGPFAIIGALIALLFLISAPSLILAYIKLRKRNLGPILDANGWAINTKARINVPFGTALTRVAVLPAGAQRDLVDPYAEKKSPWPKVAIFIILLYVAYFVLSQSGFINSWTGGRLGKQRSTSQTSGVIDNRPSSQLSKTAK